MKISKIISGGQTGVDRAALDAAISLGLEHGGFCPKGRLAEDGIISDQYNLTELKSSQYLMRTFENVKSSDGTLIIHAGIIAGGTLKTKDYCKMESKPYFEINLLEDLKKIQVNFDNWLDMNTISILNISGPRESEAHVYKRVNVILMELLINHVK